LFTVELLRAIKDDHEHWVRSRLERPRPSAERSLILHAALMVRGQDLMDIVGSAGGRDFRHADPRTSEEAQLIAGFLQDLADWGEVWDIMDEGDRVLEAHRMSERLRELLAEGLFVYATRYEAVHSLDEGDSLRFPVAFASVQPVRRRDDRGTQVPI
jgi:hypothetical protein